LGDRVADEVAPAGEALLQRVQAREYLFHRFVVRLLSRGESGPVYAVVQVRVDEFVDQIDLAAQGRGVVVARLRTHAVEGAVEHADDLGGFVVDDGPGLPVPQGRHGAGAGVIGLRQRVGLVQPFAAVDLVAARAGKSLVEATALSEVIGSRRGGRNYSLVTFELY